MLVKGLMPDEASEFEGELAKQMESIGCHRGRL